MEGVQDPVVLGSQLSLRQHLAAVYLVSKLASGMYREQEHHSQSRQNKCSQSWNTTHYSVTANSGKSPSCINVHSPEDLHTSEAALKDNFQTRQELGITVRLCIYVYLCVCVEGRTLGRGN